MIITATGTKIRYYIREGYENTVNEIINQRQEEVNKLLKERDDKIEMLKKALNKVADRACEPCCLYADEALEELE